MKKIIALGECMLELVPQGDQLIQKSYAGDTYNALVYAKKLNPQLSVSFLSGAGDDWTSQDMLSFWQRNGVESDKVLIDKQATIGIYSIFTDEHGERSFSYWRERSAASQIFKHHTVAKLTDMCRDAELVFFSGIGLAILSDEDKHKMIELVSGLKQLGCKIAFDPNYRPKMWRNHQHAIEWLEKAYQASTILLPGIEEHEQLFGHQNQQQILDFCAQFKPQEVIIKAGKQGVFAYKLTDLIKHQPFEPAPVQVDSTAAGDSFAGTYLGARVSGNDIGEAVKKACFVAGQVVQHKGAIMPDAAYQEKIKTLIN